MISVAQRNFTPQWFVQPFKPKGSETGSTGDGAELYKPKVVRSCRIKLAFEARIKRKQQSHQGHKKDCQENCKKIIGNMFLYSTDSSYQKQWQNESKLRLESSPFHPTDGAISLPVIWTAKHWSQFHCHLNSHNFTVRHCFTPFRNSRSE